MSGGRSYCSIWVGGSQDYSATIIHRPKQWDRLPHTLQLHRISKCCTQVEKHPLLFLWSIIAQENIPFGWVKNDVLLYYLLLYRESSPFDSVDLIMSLSRRLPARSCAIVLYKTSKGVSYSWQKLRVAMCLIKAIDWRPKCSDSFMKISTGRRRKKASVCTYLGHRLTSLPAEQIEPHRRDCNFTTHKNKSKKGNFSWCTWAELFLF